MPLSLEVALGYLRSRPSRLVSSVSLLSIGGIALGVAALVVAMGLLSGYRSEIQGKLIGANAEVVVFPLSLPSGGLSRPPGAPGALSARPAGQGDRGGHLPVGRGVLRGDARRDGRDHEGRGPGAGARGVADRRLSARRAARAHARLARGAAGRRDRRRARPAPGRPRGGHDRPLRARTAPRAGPGSRRAPAVSASAASSRRTSPSTTRSGSSSTARLCEASAGWTPRPTSSRSSSTRSATPRAPRGRSRRRPGRASR